MNLLRKLKLSSLVMIILFMIAAVFAVFFYFGKVKAGTLGTPVEEPVVTDEVLVLGYIYFIAAVCLAVYVAIRGVIHDPGSLKNLLISVGAFIGIILLSFLISNNNLIPDFSNEANEPSVIRFVDTGLKAVYIFGGLALAGILYTEIAGMLRSN